MDMPTLRSIAVGMDGSPSSEMAFEWALELAKLGGASLTIVGAIPLHRVYATQTGSPVEPYAGARRTMSELLREHAEFARQAGVHPVRRFLLEGSAVDRLLNFLEGHRPDLMVLGARGISSARRALLGSVSEGVLHHAHGSILIVRLPSPRGAPEVGPAPRSFDPNGTRSKQRARRSRPLGDVRLLPGASRSSRDPPAC
jgi:nucleotide-binding universal stress UspA family protein